MTKVVRVVSGVIVDNQRRILMGKRPMGKKRGGLWELPGGKVDGDEGLRTALRREWREELDVNVSVGMHIATCVLELEVVLVVDLYQVTCDDIERRRPLAHDELLWADPTHTMEFWPCSPAYYLHYAQLARWLAT